MKLRSSVDIARDTICPQTLSNLNGKSIDLIRGRGIGFKTLKKVFCQLINSTHNPYHFHNKTSPLAFKTPPTKTLLTLHCTFVLNLFPRVNRFSKNLEKTFSLALTWQNTKKLFFNNLLNECDAQLQCGSIENESETISVIAFEDD